MYFWVPAVMNCDDGDDSDDERQVEDCRDIRVLFGSCVSGLN